ncbi:hypothetical protein CAC42_5475 [Sphaceloma murrayae]|uniref:SMP-30/Gluconolactonase/LRE-like region domain-containing protein n=1 Tax=Sphaceloma murrayae TaxID=2082308 RepID=A0A2K1QJF6_9PEZI|nr:hypothetical protein CAC42_5475 [Sphaceloma murrayae]
MADITFETLLPEFSAIVGDSPSAQLLAETETSSGEPLYHEACVYHALSKSVFVTSNQLAAPAGSECPGGKTIRLHQIHTLASGGPTTGLANSRDVTPASLANSFLNGGVNYGQNGLLMCAQGSLDANHASGLVVLPIDGATGEIGTEIKPILTSFHGIPFNAVNDVVVHPEDGSIWFTDPCYGYHQGIRKAPQLPNQVYRFDPGSGSVRAVADGFTRPNGLCFSPDAKTMYITDTGAIHGSGDVPFDHAGPSHIYAFDVVQREGGDFLTNRRLFAYAPGKLPDGIKCDTMGNVYSGCMDGVEVWNSRGDLIGLIRVPGGVANFCFGERAEMFLCNETKFWKVSLKGKGVRGALLGI